MGRNNSDFYHGTSHDFQPGDVVKPLNGGLAWAATNRSVAEQYGPSVYRVEPIADVSRVSGAAKEFGIHASKTGFRVLGKAD